MADVKYVKCISCGRFLPINRWNLPVCDNCDTLPEYYEVLMNPLLSSWRMMRMFAGRYGDDGEFHGEA